MENCISRKEAISKAWGLNLETGYDNEKVVEMLRELSPVTPGRVYLVTFDGYLSGYGSYTHLLGIFDNYEALAKAIENLPEELRNPHPVEYEEDEEDEEDEEYEEIEPRIKITECSINDVLKVEKLRWGYKSPVCLGGYAE